MKEEQKTEVPEELKRHQEIVNQRKDELKKAEESKGAAEDDKSKEKTEEPSEEEKVILEMDDNELDEEGLTQKQAIQEKLERMEKKVDSRKDEIQKEINQQTAQLKALEGDVGKLKEAEDRIRKLEEALFDLTSETEQRKKEENQQSEKQTVEETVKQREQDRISKYSEEDKEKPYAERREMSKDDMGEFQLEDPVEFSEWIYVRNSRRQDEKLSDREELTKKEKSEPEDVQSKEFQAKALESLKKVWAEYPGIKACFDGTHETIVKMEAEGKDVQEIVKSLMEENKDFRLFNEIAAKNPDFKVRADGPELILAEMKKQSQGKVYTEEEVERIKAEAAENAKKELSKVDQGINSTRGRGGLPNKVGAVLMTEKQLGTWRKAFKGKSDAWIAERYKFIKERRSSIRGADNFKDEEDKVVEIAT